ncbi:hypothetical protein FVR03_03770 [Pontibacter qinzhouensis]|uniref:Uncharacterized protein n=1 Tax=Pontibacter qinzhouensis TaxID=2603253 RepID=A0A5C8KDX9_9BACT|nr:hypothetical protein [Pontibacter qinzhouensis]TXK51337.1 hypothetical protein FVR03_03770 [Pontibacter qinzhouensis]
MLDILRSLLISFLTVTVLLPVVRYALRRMAPAHHAPAITEDESKFIQKQEWKLMFFYYFFSCVLGVFCAGSLSLLSSIINMPTGTDLYLLTPNFEAMFAPGLLLGLILAFLPLRLVQQTLLGQEYELYQTYLQHQEGHKSLRTYGFLLSFLLLLALVLAFFAMRWHVTIAAEKLTITNLLLQERTYSMQQIESIRYLGKEGEYLIMLHDKTLINTTYLKPVNLDIIALLSQNSGKTVIR